MNEQKLEMNEQEIKDVTPSWLIEVDEYEEKVLSEEESIREMYDRALPEDYDGETIIVDQIRLFMSCKDKTSKTGKEYRSHNNITKIYIDEDETSIAFFDEFFDKYDEETDILVAHGQNPIVQLLQVLTGNPRKNVFKIKYSAFAESLKEIDKLKIKIYSYYRGNYENWSFRVLTYSQK